MKIELCAASVEAIKAANSLGLDRIELCANLEQGGLTPSLGFINLALDLGIETHVLIRPRIGGFQYSNEEVDVILKEIESIANFGVHGIVLGALNDRMRINREVMMECKNLWKDRSITFHRAFDDLVEWKSELKWLMDQGYTRVLSSGVSRSIENGIPILAEMKKYAQNTIQIMAGGGVNLANVAQILSTVSPDSIHFSGTSKESLEPKSLFSETRLIFDLKKASKLTDFCRNFK